MGREVDVLALLAMDLVPLLSGAPSFEVPLLSAKGAVSPFGPRRRGLLITAYLHHITLDTAATASRVARLSIAGVDIII